MALIVEMTTKTIYNQVLSSEETLDQLDDETLPPLHRPYWRKLLIASVVVAILIGLFTIVYSFVIYHNQHLAQQAGASQDMYDYGETTKEARQLGCIFDTTMQLWIPEKCDD